MIGCTCSAVFRACLPRALARTRGRSPLPREALHFFTVENVRWRALPERFGPWSSVWKRFDRLSKAGVFEVFLRRARVHEFHGASPSDVRLHRRACACFGLLEARGARRASARAGRVAASPDENACKFGSHSGDITAFDLTGGEAFDGRHFETLLDIGPDIQPRAVICDKGYASKANRDAARARGIAPVIPHKANEKNKPAFFARILYKARARIEQGVGRLKRFKRVALRCEKTERNFRSIVSFAAGLCLIKFVHTA